MANPGRLIKSAMSAGARGAKKAPKVAAEVATGSGGFPAGSWDEILHMMTIGGDRSNDALLKAQALAGKNPARLRQLTSFGIDPSTARATPALSVGPEFMDKLNVGKGKSQYVRQSELPFDNIDEPIRKGGPPNAAEQVGLFPDRNPKDANFGLADEAAELPTDGLQQGALDFTGPSKLSALKESLKRGMGSRTAAAGLGLGAAAGGVYAANKMVPAGAFGKQFDPMQETQATPEKLPFALGHSQPQSKYKASGSTNAYGGAYELGGKVDTRSGKGESQLSVYEPEETVAPMPSRSGGRGMARRAMPKASGLTGQNGVRDIDLSGLFGPSEQWQDTLASVDDTVASSQGALDKYNQGEEQEQGGGFGDLMKTLGPLIAALLMGRMIK